MIRREFLALPAALLDGGDDPLSDKDSRSFDDYVATVEYGLRKGFRLRQSETHRATIERGEVAVSTMVDPHPRHIGNCFIHDWAASALAPRITADRLVALLQDFNRHQEIYRPEVERSRLLGQEGETYRSFLRFRKKKIITVVLNCEYQTHFQIEAKKGKSIVHSTRICEVEKPGQREEQEKPPGQGFGFLWRMNSYWQWEETEQGLLMELRSVSLSRAVPAALAWAVSSIINSMPRESLVFTLDRTRQALR
jgi:hypothetical protein